ncbi:MAG: CAAD domain-containing protein [Prochlorococcaceae cyanobacterium]
MADTQRDEIESNSGPDDSRPAESVPSESGPCDTVPPDSDNISTAAAETPAAATPPTAPEAPAAAGSSSPAAEAAPVLEASTTVPPLSGSSAAGPVEGGEGGEWDLLVQKLQEWWASGRLQSVWQQARTPLTFGLGLVALLLVLRLYAGLLAAINSLPLVPGLLELVGVIWLLRNGLPRMIRRSEREQLLQGLQHRWQSFSGRD